MRPTARAAVLGFPIGHSKSPALHTAAYRHLGLDIDYEAIDVDEEQLTGFMAAARSAPGWAGLSVTMPLKAAMVQCVDELSPAAASLGVVNTVTFDGGSAGGIAVAHRLTGHNTDIAGIARSVEHAGGTGGTSAVLLGAGGTALAAAAALAEMGITDLSLCLRTPARAAETVDLAERLGLAVTVAPLDDSASLMRNSPLVISTLPPHAADELAADPLLRNDGSSASGVLLDVAYDPWPSALASAWAARGGRIVPGLEMLLYQGLEQVRLFTGRRFQDEPGVINAMCDAVGLPRRGDRAQDMAG